MGGMRTSPVSLVVTESTEPILQVLPSVFDFGFSDTAKPITISNVGVGTLSWAIQESIPWLSCSSASGTSGATTPSAVTIQVDRSGQNDGTYPGELTITSNGGTCTMQVSMKVNNSKLSVSTQTLDFGTSSSGAEKLFTIGNTGGGTLKWTVSVPKEVDWLSLRKTNGSDSKTISGSDDEKITATIGKDNMDAGTYAGSIAITSNGGNATINVSMVVGPPCL